MKLLASFQTKFNLNPLYSFSGEIYSFVKLLYYPTEPPKYSTRIERDPVTIMTEEKSVKSIETIKKIICVSTNCLQKNFINSSNVESGTSNQRMVQISRDKLQTD